MGCNIHLIVIVCISLVLKSHCFVSKPALWAGTRSKSRGRRPTRGHPRRHEDVIILLRPAPPPRCLLVLGTSAGNDNESERNIAVGERRKRSKGTKQWRLTTSREEEEGMVGATQERRSVFSWLASSSLAVSTSWPRLARAIENINDTSVDVMNQERKEMIENKSVLVKGGGTLTQINDVYPALVYTPPAAKLKSPGTTRFPVLVVLHGAGQNDLDVWNLADIRGEHSGLLPSLISSGMAPQVVLENFIVVAPYSLGKRSFYEEPRGKLLQSIQSITNLIDERLLPVDRDKQYLFGFSDGATLGVELMTTRKFAAGIFAAYGFTGTLPQLALERLKGKPMWIFHSADDVIFPVKCSDRLVKDLRIVNDGMGENLIKYSRFDRDQEGFSGAVRGHSTGITASKDPEIYKWLLSL